MKRVLLVDDDNGILEVMRIILEGAGFNVMLFSSGKGIQKKIREYMPDLILLDLWMPGIDGKEVTRMLKKERETKHIPIIIVSAINDTDKIAKEIGADDFIEKPFDMDNLVAKVHKHTLV